jgi:hypothetical protein
MTRITLVYDDDETANMLFRIMGEAGQRQISGATLGILRDNVGKADDMRRDANPLLKAVLVYQGGIANVFQVDCLNMADFGRNAKRLLQGDFATCAAFAHGLGIAGVVVRTAACNQAGDITNAHWTENLEEQPFSDKFINVALN